MSISLEISTTAPGAVGAITDFILKSSVKPQPALALGAALALVGALKAHRVQTETGLRTNLLIANIAPSGAGKNAPIEICKRLLSETLLDSLILGKPASDVGLITALSENNGSGIVLWDEFGHALKAFTVSNQAHYQREIVGTMCELFTCAGSSYTGKSYADGQLRKTVHVDQPHLCVLGASTPDRLYDCLTSQFVEDGFIPRWLFVEPEQVDPKTNYRPLRETPLAIKNLVRSLYEQPTYAGPRQGDLDCLRIKPRIVELEAKCLPLQELLSDYFALRIAEHKSELIRAIYARGVEHALKVALTLSSEVITHQELSWSWRFVASCLDAVVQRIGQHTVRSRTESDLKKVMNIIYSHQAISKNELTRKTQWLTTAQREDIIKTLLASLQVSVYCERTPGANRPTVYYKSDIQ